MREREVKGQKMAVLCRRYSVYTLQKYASRKFPASDMTSNIKQIGRKGEEKCMHRKEREGIIHQGEEASFFCFFFNAFLFFLFFCNWPTRTRSAPRMPSVKQNKTKKTHQAKVIK